MSRRQVRFIVAVVVAVLLTAVGYRLTVSLWAQRIADEEIQKLTSDLSSTADQRMKNFHRFKVRDGKKVWEIAAQQAHYLKDGDEVLVDAPEFSLYQNDGGVMTLRGREARVHLSADQQEVTQVELNGDLEVHMGDFLIKTQHAVFEDGQNTISSSGAVQISGPGLQAEGQGYMVDVTSKHLTLNADVQTIMTRGKG
jgi:LPS export ABC transporter protein LptC